MNEIWQQALTIIRRAVPVSSYEQWFSREAVPSVVLEDNYVYLCAADEYVKDALSRLYLDLIQETLSAILQMDVIVKVVDLRNERIPDGKMQDRDPKPIEPPVFNPRYTFESFVVGGSNRFAHAAAMAVAETPSRAYNPLFLYGGSGLGKTHLMHAIGQTVMKKDPHKRVVYVSSETFTNEFISLLRAGRLEGFKSRYRSADILLIDDIQFLINKTETQEEFFHTFNALHDAGKQIVISSDRPPRDLNPLEERLRSRFEWGLTTDIQPPDWETRCAILQQKALSENIHMDDEVTYFIADKVQANIRELEGTLNKVICYTQMNHRHHIDMAIALEALKGVIDQDEPVKLTIPLIQKAVGNFFQISVEDLKSKKKDRFITYPRQIAMYLCREMMGATQPQIGREFGNRDHTTVIHACEKIKDSRKTDPQLERTLSELEKELKGGR